MPKQVRSSESRDWTVAPSSADKRRRRDIEDDQSVCDRLDEKRVECLRAVQFLMFLSDMKEFEGIEAARPTVGPLSRSGLRKFINEHPDYRKDVRYGRIVSRSEFKQLQLDEISASLETGDESFITERLSDISE